MTIVPRLILYVMGLSIRYLIAVQEILAPFAKTASLVHCHQYLCRTYKVTQKTLFLAQSQFNNYKTIKHMKTDLERTKEFLDSLGILHYAAETIVKFGDYWAEDCPECDKIAGYNGFYTCFEFSKDGKFLTVGAWE